jgi:hypothetical protein
METRRESAAAFGFSVIGAVDRGDGDDVLPDVWGGWRTVALFLDANDRAMDSADY